MSARSCQRPRRQGDDYEMVMNRQSRREMKPGNAAHVVFPWPEYRDSSTTRKSIAAPVQLSVTRLARATNCAWMTDIMCRAVLLAHANSAYTSEIVNCCVASDDRVSTV